MNRSSTPLGRRTALMAALVFLLTFTAVAGVAMNWARVAAAPRIILLGSGDALSILVIAGPSRLLIATGENTTDFGNALDSALPPTIRRLDVLLVAGGGKQSAVAAHALSARHAQYRAVIGPALPLSFDAPVDVSIDTLTGARRFQLSTDISVTVDIDGGTGKSDQASEVAWRALINHRGTSVLIISSAAAIDRFPPADPTSALIVARGDPGNALADIETPLLVVCETVAKPKGWREGLAGADSSTVFVLPVADGSAQSLRIADDGLHIPRGAQPIPTQAVSQGGH